MKALKDLKDTLLEDPEVKQEYDRLEDEFNLASLLIEARSKAGLSQIELAKRMGVSQPDVARLESGRHNPSLKTLQKFAAATGHQLSVRMLPKQ